MARTVKSKVDPWVTETQGMIERYAKSVIGKKTDYSLWGELSRCGVNISAQDVINTRMDLNKQWKEANPYDPDAIRFSMHSDFERSVGRSVARSKYRVPDATVRGRYNQQYKRYQETEAAGIAQSLASRFGW